MQKQNGDIANIFIILQFDSEISWTIETTDVITGVAGDHKGTDTACIKCCLFLINCFKQMRFDILTAMWISTTWYHDGANKHLRNVGKRIPSYTAQNPTSYLSLWDLTSHCDESSPQPHTSL
jgi:hypothetical protein